MNKLQLKYVQFIILMFLRTKEKIMSRKPIIAGNWKMNLCQSEAKSVFEGVKNFVKDYSAKELPTIVIAPVFTSIAAVESVKCDCGCGCGNDSCGCDCGCGNDRNDGCGCEQPSRPPMPPPPPRPPRPPYDDCGCN